MTALRAGEPARMVCGLPSSPTTTHVQRDHAVAASPSTSTSKLVITWFDFSYNDGSIRLNPAATISAILSGDVALPMPPFQLPSGANSAP
jgi:hypothetical protein